MSQYKIEFKFKMVMEIVHGAERVSEVACRYGVSRASLHRWLKRFKEKGFEGLRDLSRAPIVVRNKTSELVEGLVIRLRSENGLRYGPLRISFLMNNGTQFIPTKDQKSKAEFGKILDIYDVKHRRTGVCKPNTNGKVERFNRTLQDEFIRVVHMENYEDAKNKLDEYIRFYNFDRPHQGIKGKTPAERYMTNNKHNQYNHVIRNGPGHV